MKNRTYYRVWKIFHNKEEIVIVIELPYDELLEIENVCFTIDRRNAEMKSNGVIYRGVRREDGDYLYEYAYIEDVSPDDVINRVEARYE